MFKGSRNCSEYLALFALPQKRNAYVGIVFLLRGKVLALYRKIEMLELQLFSFGVMQKFRPFSRPLNNGLEKNDFNNFNCI